LRAARLVITAHYTLYRSVIDFSSEAFPLGNS
jgi:hypothetical protein